MPKKQLLRKNTPRAINTQPHTLTVPPLQTRCHIREKRRSVDPVLVPVPPEVALQVLERGDLGIVAGELLDVRLERGGRGPGVLRESVTVGDEGWCVPLLLQD